MKAQDKISIFDHCLLTREQFVESYERPGAGESGVEVLDEHSIFPDGRLTYHNKKFHFVNLLGLYTHFSGTLRVGYITETGSYSAFQGGIGSFLQCKDPGDRARKIRDLREQWTEELGLKFRAQKDGTSFGKHGGTYGRLLHLIGFSTSVLPEEGYVRSTKTGRGATLPEYLSSLIANYSHINGEGKELVRPYLRDLVSVFFDTQARTRGLHLCVEMDLPAQRTESLLRSEADKILQALNFLYPCLQPSPTIRVAKHKEFCRGAIILTRPYLIAASSSHGSFPIKIKAEISPRFGFESWNRFVGKKRK